MATPPTPSTSSSPSTAETDTDANPTVTSGPTADGPVGDGSLSHRQPDAGLRHAAIGFAIAAALHNGDHFRRGTSSVTTALLGVGYLAMAITIAAVVVVLLGHRTAPIVAISAGIPLAIGFTSAHWLPTWSALSDSFVEGGASVVSIVASLLEIAGALWFALAGFLALRRNGGLASAAL